MYENRKKSLEGEFRHLDSQYNGFKILGFTAKKGNLMCEDVYSQDKYYNVTYTKYTRYTRYITVYVQRHK